jgi:hypothetical protein
MILGNEIYLSVRQIFFFCINCLFTRFYQVDIPACLTQTYSRTIILKARGERGQENNSDADEVKGGTEKI